MSRITRFLAVLPMLALAIAVGCGKPEDKFVGHYNGKMTISAQAQDKIKNSGAQGAQMLQGMLAATLGLELKQDKTFALTTSMLGQSNVTNGTWSLDNSQITMQGTDASGAAQGTPSKLNSSDDGKTLTAVNNIDPGSTMVFTRG